MDGNKKFLFSVFLQELDIKSIHCNAKQEYKRRQSYRKRNLLNRNFTASKPNQIWVSDITYFKVKGYGLYLCVILDLFSRKAIAYNISRKASTYLVTSTLGKLLLCAMNPGLSFFTVTVGHSIRQMHLHSFCFKMMCNSPSQHLADLSIMRYRKLFSPHSKRRRLIAEIICLSGTFVKA